MRVVNLERGVGVSLLVPQNPCGEVCIEDDCRSDERKNVRPESEAECLAIAALRVAVDRAWNSVPPERRTANARDRIARAIVQSATLGERDPARLSAYAVTVFDLPPVFGIGGSHASL